MGELPALHRGEGGDQRHMLTPLEQALGNTEILPNREGKAEDTREIGDNWCMGFDPETRGPALLTEHTGCSALL